jgi:hypothetical protein
VIINGYICQESVGPDNILGYDRVQQLADYLVRLRPPHLSYLTHREVGEIEKLWNALYDNDILKLLW